jgi:hypothetical protein
VRKHSLIHLGSLALCLVLAIVASDAAQQAVLSASDPVAADTRTCSAISSAVPAGFNDFRQSAVSGSRNSDISRATLDPGSNAIISFNRRSRSLHPEFGEGAWGDMDAGASRLLVDKSNCWLYQLWSAYPQENTSLQTSPPHAANLAAAPAL